MIVLLEFSQLLIMFVASQIVLLERIVLCLFDLILWSFYVA